ncbi:MAG: hypothetical protein ACREAD_03215 [Nitrosopumilaceae archaeon]
MTYVESELMKQSPSESLQFQIATNHFLIQTCSYCNNKMELVEGDVIYGDKWFHGSCWKVIKNGGSKNV